MLRILTFSSLFPHAEAPGFGQFVEAQSLQLAALPETDVRVIAPLPRRPALPSRLQPCDRLPHAESWRGLTCYRPRFTALPWLGGWTHVDAIVRAALPLMRRIRAEGFDFDVIDAEFFFPCGVAAARLGEILDRPVSIMARGSDIHYWGRHRGARHAILDAGQKASRLLAVSEAMRTDMIALGLPASKISVHYMGIDLTRFALRDRAREKQKRSITGPLLLSAGNLIALKGHDIMLQALKILPHVSLCIAGDGPERGALESLATQLGVRERVHFLGRVPHEDMPSLMAAADIMALASEREGLATAWLESLASGTPIVTPEVGGIAEVITAPTAGRIASARSPAAMAEAIRAILDAPPHPNAVRAHALPFEAHQRAEALRAHFSAIRR